MFKNNRILIVDDQEDLREQLGKLLVSWGKPNKTSTLVQSMRARLMGLDSEKQDPKPKFTPQYDIDTAGQGQEAFEMVKAANENNAPYAVMFTDMRMPPGWDGLKTAKKIREIDKNIEIVIMTAYADHDQDVIAREIGTPDKLFYIKKPFQAEEIFQLAMSLTAKWSSENLSRIHRSWLEKTLVCMRRARHFGKEYNAPYMATLESFLSFLNSNQGIIAEWDKDNSEWILKGRKNVEKVAAEEFFKKNAGRIQESSVIQSNVDEFYVIPLKNNEFCVSIGIQGAQTENDPEWYKLLNLLLTTSLEGLENSSIKAKKNFESTKTREMLALSREIYSDVEALEKKYSADKTIKTVLNKISKLLKFFKQKDLSDL